jgi:hypothetical protein
VPKQSTEDRTSTQPCLFTARSIAHMFYVVKLEFVSAQAFIGVNGR